MSLEISLGTLLAWIFPVIGLGMILWNLFSYHKAQQATSWQSVSGKVLESFVQVKNGSRGAMYKPEIRYEYKVNGEYFIADCWRFGAVAKSWGKAQSNQVAAEYPVGRSVTVFFNPERPQEAVLEPGKTDWSGAGFGAFFTLLGLAIFFISLS